MSAAEVLEELSRRGVALKAKGDRLLYQPKQKVDVDLRYQMIRNKATLLSFASHFDEWYQKNDDGLLKLSALVN